ncbi:MAG: hypothetical protein STSR0009_03770 [Methanoregula sp.]
MPGIPPPPSRHLDMDGTPREGTRGWGYTPFYGRGFTSELDPVALSRKVM